ncbi:insulinase family protein [Parabacteroides sp. OttesenSCG-928-G07]|nr:insulinase family protein [Parabacteroides sp. OttesenSCG-928-G21]MDL2277053.1 insulinase family protein [Parabacteroides sp. OttesenSCG-928-G07]
MTKQLSSALPDDLQSSKALTVKEYTLSNGLTVWLNEDHSQPKVLGTVVVKAGAKNSPDTGIAHYFEHIMFKGTDKIGTVDYEKERVLLDQISAKYDELAATEDDFLRAEIQQAINGLSVQAAEYVIPNEFDRLISRYGGTKLNAGTSFDFTVYFNTFSPQYIRQWAIINSERLINPVFRMFQSELETVYEEKNMYSDQIGAQAIERITRRFFSPHPYEYPIIGSSTHLKNPQLSAMRSFFETYYVASNMGLILSGDFDSESVKPLLEETFGRVRNAEVPVEEPVKLPGFKKRQKMTVRVPMPFVRIMLMGFRGVPANHPDEIPLKIALSLLNNSNGTGFLDKLTLDHKLLASMAMTESLNEAGALIVVTIPKFLFQSYAKAEKMVWEAINKVKRGEFSDEVFLSLKQEQKRNYSSELEDISSRSEMMMRVFSQGKRWDNYLKEIAHIDELTKEDIVEVANSYFTDNYLYVTKKTGKYVKDNLPKPNYLPIIPGHPNAQSAFAQALEEIPTEEIVPRFIDFKEDVEMVALKPLVKVYKTPNRVNDIFTLKISFGIGNVERPLLSQVAVYLNLIGTKTHSFEVFKNRLQILGSTLSCEVTETDFNLQIKGDDKYFAETLELVGLFMREPQEDPKKLKQVKDEASVMEKAFMQSSESMAMALHEKIKYGDASVFLRRLSLKEIKKIKSSHLVNAFLELQQTECNLHYCGNLPIDEVTVQVNRYLPFESERIPTKSPYYREIKGYDRPLVYFYDMPDVSQSIIYGYITGDSLKEEKTRYASRLFGYYFGGDMSSVMFQEIREFRSYAYRVNARYHLSLPKYADRPGDFMTMLSTQSDKTIDALSILDGLLTDMPVKEEKIDAIKQSIVNHVSNNYPTFRDLSTKIANYQRNGYESDPNIPYLEYINDLKMKDIVDFYKQHIQGHTVVYGIVGNSKKIDLDKLRSFGEIVFLKKEEICNLTIRK